MNRTTLEFKVALILIYAISSDAGDITEKEMNKLYEVGGKIFKEFGIELDSENFISDCFEEYNNIDENETNELVTSAVLNLGETQPIEKLEYFYNGIEEIDSADNLSSSEKEVLQSLGKTWGLFAS